MQITLFPSSAKGKIKAIASKSVAHRMLICAAFANEKTLILCEEANDDINATVDCLCALGALITRKAPYYEVTPIKKINKKACLPCNESGSTLRFLLPVCAALDGEFTFEMRGRLPSRPLSPLKEVLEAHGTVFSRPTDDKLTVCGSLSGSNFEISGGVSSQFITGLLFALTLLKRNSMLTITGKLESAPYVDITLDALSIFGVDVNKNENTYNICAASSLISPKNIDVEGDWSNAAFPLSLGIIGKNAISVDGLNPVSKQGDRMIVDLLRRFGGKIEQNGSRFTAFPSKLCGIDIDASQIPDLVPIIATVASIANGKTVIRGASRLRLKESDRLLSISTVLSELGASVTQSDDGLIINGRPSLIGGKVSSFGDHRIAMSAAVASVACAQNVTIDGAEATQKSYPDFWRDMRALGISFTEN